MIFVCVFPAAKFEPLIWLNNPRADTILGCGGLTPLSLVAA
jgi:hypothetical protein